MSKKKIEQIILDCLAFAMLFLTANHAGAIVLHMPFSNHGDSFNMNL